MRRVIAFRPSRVRQTMFWIRYLPQRPPRRDHQAATATGKPGAVAPEPWPWSPACQLWCTRRVSCHEQNGSHPPMSQDEVEALLRQYSMAPRLDVGAPLQGRLQNHAHIRIAPPTSDVQIFIAGLAPQPSSFSDGAPFGFASQTMAVPQKFAAGRTFPHATEYSQGATKDYDASADTTHQVVRGASDNSLLPDFVM